MADVSINNGVTLKGLSFQGKKENGTKSSDDKKMKTSTKIMIGASALATIVVGGLLVTKALKKGKIPQEMGELKPSDLGGKPAPRTTSELVQETNEVKASVADELNELKPSDLGGKPKSKSTNEIVQEVNEVKPSSIEEIPVADEVKQEIKQQPKPEITQEKANVQEVVSETNEVLPSAEEKVETAVESKVKEIKHNYIEDSKNIAPYLKDGEPVEESLTRYILDRDKNSLENSFTLENSYLKRYMEEGNEIKYVTNSETGAIEIKCGEYSFPSREFERMPDGKIERLDLGDRDIDMLERNLGEFAENQIREGEYIAEELNSVKEDKEYLLNRIAEYVRTVGGFKKCNKVINYTDGYGNRESIRIIYEGVGCDITEDGRLLQKVVLYENEKQYVNILDRIRQHAAECAREYVCSVY